MPAKEKPNDGQDKKLKKSKKLKKIRKDKSSDDESYGLDGLSMAEKKDVISSDRKSNDVQDPQPRKAKKEKVESDVDDHNDLDERAPRALHASKKESKKSLKKKESQNSDSKEEDNDLPDSRRSKSRLILGDGNFSFSRAYLQKQIKKQEDNNSTLDPSSILVTEHASEQSLKDTYVSKENEMGFRNFEDNVTALRTMGAKVDFKIDAKHIGFLGRRFRRIHFNFPYYNDKKLNSAQNKALTRELVGGFFASAAEIQKPGDRIHMALARFDQDPVWYEDATYGVAEFCETYGYAYIKKRNFIDPESKRYPGYFHVKTAANVAVETAETGREYVFEKKRPGIDYENLPEKRRTKWGKDTLVLKNIDTDSGSSSCVESDAEPVPHAAARKMS